MQFASLGSGSRGNGTLVEAAGTLVMLDCGEFERTGLEGFNVARVSVIDHHLTDRSAPLISS